MNHHQERMAPTAVYMLAFDGFADWEPAHALAELRRSGNREVVVAGFDPNPVVSMGGLRVLPDTSLREVAPEQIGILILPGGDRWGTGQYAEPALSLLLIQLEAAGTPIAAICGATLALAHAGLLNDRRHTSTVPGDLNVVPGYSGATHYVTEPAVTDRGVITASGLASVDFARHVFAQLGIFSESDEAEWFAMYKSGRLPGTAVQHDIRETHGDSAGIRLGVFTLDPLRAGGMRSLDIGVELARDGSRWKGARVVSFHE